MIVYAMHLRSRLSESSAWPQAEGMVTKAILVTAASNDSAEHSVDVEYEFVANGSRYTGKRVTFGRRGWARKAKAQAELEKYPVNSAVMVFFNPQNPEDSVLIRDAPYATMYLWLGIVMFLFALGLWVLTAAK